MVRWKTALATGVGLTLLVSIPALAKPLPGQPKPGFRLFASALTRFRGNNVDCAMKANGAVCVATSSVEGGGYWPTGTRNQYIFATGLQLAGKINSNATAPTFSLNGTIGGSFFYDNAAGDGTNAEPVTDVWNSADAADLANWPTIANVPSDTLYDPARVGQKVASDNDVWYMAWEGNPALNGAGHIPIGIAVETRGLAYTSPDKRDLVFFIYNIYNISSSVATDYDAIEAARGKPLADTLRALGARFHALNDGTASGPYPAGGYSIDSLFVAFDADMDVTFENSGINWAGVNLPFQLGYTFESVFSSLPSWSFADTSIYHRPFFKGAGFVGVKYLASPQNLGISVFSTITRSGTIIDPANIAQLYRYLTGQLSAADGSCNVPGVLTTTHMCYIEISGPQDMRFFQSSGPLSLPAGGSGTVAVAYVLAAPLPHGTCTGPSACTSDLTAPNIPTNSFNPFASPASIAAGANTVDYMMGFDSYLGDLNLNGKVDQNEIKSVPGSLLGKAATAQKVFDAKFSAPAPPASPNFYLIPGDHQVTVVWQPSPTDDPANADPYYTTAHRIGPTYDPNYRANDVAGYRIYRGSTTDLGSFVLLAQLDKTGDVMIDSTGQISNGLGPNNTSSCVPARAIFVSCTQGITQGGLTLIVPRTVPVNGNVIQVQATLPGPDATAAYVSQADTSVSSAFPVLNDGGVPYVFVDKAGNCQGCGVSNNKTYYYVVTAFDVNSVGPGVTANPSSLESSRTRFAPVTPAGLPTNVTAVGDVVTHVIDANGNRRDEAIPNLPTLDPATGMFSGPMPPADNASMAFVGQFVGPLFQGAGPVGSATLVGLSLGDARNAVPVIYNWEVVSPDKKDTVQLSFPLQQTAPTDGSSDNVETGSAPLPLQLTPDPVQAARYGVQGNLTALVQVKQGIFPYQVTNAQGRSCAAEHIPPTSGSNCTYFGPRWFQGANETKSDPNAGNASGAVTDFNNAGELPGVSIIHHPEAYSTVNGVWRQFDAVLGGAVRAADFNLTWGANGKIASVLDVTHNVPVPFMRDSVGGGWGILNQAATTAAGSFDGQPGVLTVADWGCVRPLKTIAGTSASVPCGGATIYTLNDSVIPGTIGLWTDDPANSQTAAAEPNLGFSMYLAGHIFMFELNAGNALPAAGTVWTMRSYIGFITGGNGTSGNLGTYKFTSFPRTFSALGATLEVSYLAVNTPNFVSSKAPLANVHTVPDPYYVTSSYENSPDNKIIKFVHLPTKAIIRIYSSSGVLVDVLEHSAPDAAGSKCRPGYVSSSSDDECVWNVRNRNGQFVASGVYFWHVESGNGRRVGRMTIVNFAK